MLLLTGAMVALLPLLAFLQYRWLGEVSRAERERMQSSLKTALANFSQEFDREITRAYMSFQIDAAALKQKDWQYFTKKYDQWREATSYPQLVKEVLLVEKGATGSVELMRFNRSASGFEQADWPASLAPMSGYFQQAFQEKTTSDHPPVPKAAIPVPEEVPAMIAPIPELPLPESRFEPHLITFAGYAIILFDSDFIKENLIPALAEKYFAGGDGVDYNIAIVTRSEPKKIVYQSQSNAKPNLESADATTNLFGLRVDMPAVVEQALGAQSESGTETKQSRISVQVLSKEPITGGPPGKEARIALMTTEGARWQVVVQHRAGSLDRAVASARQKNLIISFGILILLGASVALVIISTRRAERLARQQMEFVAGVSHEMRTPLAVIRSAGENLADGFVADREQVRRYGSLIEGEGRRLTEMVEQALEFAGIQSNRRAYELRPASVKQIIESALAATSHLIAESAFEIEKEIEPDLPMIAADKEALSRAIQNLITNAIKYSREERRVKISARKSANEKEARISVEDNGLGIHQSELARIFEPFYRGREAIAAQIHGNGLGLSLVRHIVEAHKGTVTVESAPGKGSSFTLHLPVMNNVDAEQSEPVGLSAGGKRLGEG